MTRKTVNLRLDPDLLTRIDEACGEIPRERWIRRVIVRQLDSTETAGTIDLGPEAQVVSRPRSSTPRHRPGCKCPVCS